MALRGEAAGEADRSGEAGPSYWTVETKLNPPPNRPGTVPRALLVDRLLASDRPVVALVAPAGYGKTTVLTQWCARTSRRAAWVSLDREDDDPAVLLADVGAALATAGPVDGGLVRAISSPGMSVAAAVARRAAAALASVGEPVLLVLDHSEALQAPDVRDAVAELALRLPPNAQLALASRAAPPLPVARLRAQGAVAEI